MARQRRRKLSIDDEIREKTQELADLKEKMKKVQEELDALEKKKDEEDQAIVLEAINKSNRTKEEILAFLNGETEQPAESE